MKSFENIISEHRLPSFYRRPACSTTCPVPPLLADYRITCSVSTSNMQCTMAAAARQGNEIRASEDPRAILSPTPAQIRHDQAKRPNFDPAKKSTKLLSRSIGATVRQHFQNLIFGGRGRALQITPGHRIRENSRLNTMKFSHFTAGLSWC